MKLRLLRGLLLFCPIMAAGGNENDVQAFEPDSVKLVAPTATHALELLKGREAGVEVISSPGHPGMVPTIHIRGLGVAARMQPVYVLNGMRVRDLDGLDPGQIDKIEVLKNASAMGIWGADAARGVVLVETKKAHQGGFHASYSGRAGIHTLSDTPVQFSRDTWAHNPPEGFWVYPVTETAETSFLHIHNLDLQYGGKKFSIYAGGSFLDNDGPYEGRKDVHRRYSAVLSANYNPFDWFSIGINGHWSDSQVDKAPDRWLESMLLNKPQYYPFRADISVDREDNWKEKAIQAAAEFRPISGLSVRAFAGILKNSANCWDFMRIDYSEPNEYYRDRLDFKTTNGDYTWKLYGAEAGYQTSFDGHRVRADINFRRTHSEDKAVRMKGTLSLDDQPEPPVLEDPPYLIYRDWNIIIPKWNEAVVSLGYDYKERVKIDISAFKMWDKDLETEDDDFWTAAASLGWNVFKKPYLNLEASWSKTGRYMPLYTDIQEWSNYFNIPGTEAYFRDYTKTEHFDVSASSSLNWGKNVLNLTAAWFKHIDMLTSSFWGLFLPYQGDDPPRLFSLHKHGIELSAALKGTSGDFRYSISGNLTFYGDVVRFGEKLLSPLEWEKDTRLYLQDGKHLGCSMTKDVYVEDGQLHSDDQDWNCSGAVFPNMAEALCVSLAWKRLQATISGHGRHGQSIRHNSRYDALYRYYRDNAGIDKVLISSDAILSSNHSILDGSFFRIDQIRLDYSLPIKGKVSAALYASLENWFLFTDYPGTDPEMSLAWDSIGVETARFPTTKRLIFGINVGF
ncbi:MAG: TonB-dependent receptor plug domain-containing protein [Bacteroidales bacterium]|nr:TonB-dependent receptor plug domain-containing protein [Bacteroidales bacterium]